ncbi:MAG TPA: lactate utilization protein C [Polyangiaceae bacterium]|jgi:L-lactate dehydrogenase complex protein LldG|nr:lactate utilization protein C [Polyangiaceae bacterium]
MQRETFLNRVAERLGRPRVTAEPARGEMGVPEAYRAAPLGTVANAGDLCEHFKRELENVGGRVAIANGRAEVAPLVRSELAHWGATRLVSWDESEFRDWDVHWLWNEAHCTPWHSGSADPEAAAKFRRAALEADVGITTVDFAIANTGTMVLSAGLSRPRSVSLLPTVHLALVRASQLVHRMGSVFADYTGRAGGPPSAVHFITGPSRTSDIENDLTIGVHGPAGVSVVVWREES